MSNVSAVVELNAMRAHDELTVLEFLHVSRDLRKEDLSVTNSCAPAAEIGSVDADFDTYGLKGDEEDEVEVKRVNKAMQTA